MRQIIAAIVTPIISALGEFFKYKSTAGIMRMKAAIEAGEKYIQVNEKEGEFKKLSKVKQKKYLKHYYRRFFKYN